MSEAEVLVRMDYKFFNPMGFQLWRFMRDPKIRLIIEMGGSSSGKSYSTAQMVLIFTHLFGENHLVMRKVGASISKTIYEDFKTAARQLNLYSQFKFKDSVRQIMSIHNEAKIDFCGLDDPEKIKGISQYKRVFLDEFSEYDEDDFKQIRKRLRGKEGQQILAAFNPISENHWIKKNVIDKETWHDLPMQMEWHAVTPPIEYTKVKGLKINSEKYILNPRKRQMEIHSPDTVLIHSTYLDNFWVVGSPDGTYGYYDNQCIADFEKDRVNDPDYYNIYALGEWGVIRTGSEFFGSFNRASHVAECPYDPTLPIHVSVDNNVLPYISFTFWQIEIINGTHIRQIAEVCAGNPDNTVRKAAKLVAAKLKEMGAGTIYLHGDASTRAANNIDEEKRSWHDLLIDALRENGIEVIDRVGTSNPSVAMSGEFINAIYENRFPGIDITIGEDCLTSIDDYISVQKDVNGAILKTRVKNKTTMQTYEEHGHLSDTKRYLVTDILKDEFTAFSNKRKYNIYAKDGALKFFNSDTSCRYDEDLVYCMPNIGGRFVYIHGRRCGAQWHIVGACCKDALSADEIKAALAACGGTRFVLECPKSYILLARELSESLDGDVRAIQENGDLPRRIAATADYVRGNLLFNPRLAEEDEEYGAFIANMLDYNRNNENIESSAVVSGFVQTAIKLGL